eukprot:TRINITY_DN851_c4_g1_i1.p1 TRINITY_DN851_c4_g1~~TRINITY_DN851_c4_g1_i1.p1  ORF type:complete len:214 (+),score=60.02 TRINITY_DN851_c4_g1_i1:167-808(+)
MGGSKTGVNVRYEMDGFVGSARCDEAWRQRIGIENRCQMTGMDVPPKGRRGMVLPEIGPPLPTGATIKLRDSELHPLRGQTHAGKAAWDRQSLRGSLASGRRALRAPLGDTQSYRDDFSRSSYATTTDSRLHHRIQHLEASLHEERENREAVREELHEIKSLMASLLKSRGVSEEDIASQTPTLRSLRNDPRRPTRLPEVASSSRSGPVSSRS